jgi:hypothetical protein
VTEVEQEVTATKRAAMRRAVFRLILGVAILDSAALGVYYLAGISTAEPRTRLFFTVAWTIVTAFVVSFLLKKVRKARFNRNY